MNARVASRLAWSIWALSLALTAASLLLMVLKLSRPDVPVYSFWIENVLLSVGFSTVGAVIVPRCPPNNPIGWLFCAIGLLWGLAHFCGQCAAYTLLLAPGALPAGEAATWVYSWLWVPSLGLLVFLALLFPDGRLFSSRLRWFARLSVLLTLAGTVLAALSPGQTFGLTGVYNPFRIESLPSFYKPIQALMLVLIAVAAASLLARRLYARGEERQQIKWFTYTASLAASGSLLDYTISEPLDAPWLGWIGQALVFSGLVGIPISMGVAILRYRLYDIDVIINRTLVYGALTVVLAAVYFGGVVALQYVFRYITGQETQLAVVASTLAIAALFNPLRHRIQGSMDRLFYRTKYDAAKTLEAFGSRLRKETDLDELSGDLMLVVRETMQPEHVSLWMTPASRLEKGER